MTSLSTSAPRPKHFVGRVRAEEPDPEDPEDPGDPASSPSLLDKRMEINVRCQAYMLFCHHSFIFAIQTFIEIYLLFLFSTLKT